MQLDLTDKRILITGGTGTLGKILIKKLLKQFPLIKEIIVFSRDEYKQARMARRLKSPHPIKFVIGDIRDSEKIVKEAAGVDILIHAAAMKCLEVCENNPGETFKTNVTGTVNVIKAANLNHIKNVLLISTDKAVEPISAYGLSKAESEKLFIKAGKESNGVFTVLRLGNIFNSRGSVFDVFKEQSRHDSFTIFDLKSTRFLVKNNSLYKSILYSLSSHLNSAIVIPRMPAFKVRDLAAAYSLEAVVIEKPLRKGEKRHELLFSSEEFHRCFESPDFFFILQDSQKLPGRELKKMTDFGLNSSENSKFLSSKKLKKLINKKSDKKAYN